MDHPEGARETRDGRLGFDRRRGQNTVHLLDGLFRQSVYGRLAGYEDVNDVRIFTGPTGQRLFKNRD